MSPARADYLRWLRWLLLLPALCACWFAALLFGLWLFDVAGSFCPPDQIVSGICTASWYPTAESVCECIGAATAAALMVVVAAVVAPKGKWITTLVVLVCGTVVAYLMAVETKEYLALLSAAFAGVVAALLVRWWIRSKERT